MVTVVVLVLVAVPNDAYFQMCAVEMQWPPSFMDGGRLSLPSMRRLARMSSRTAMCDLSTTHDSRHIAVTMELSCFPELRSRLCQSLELVLPFQ